MLTSYPVTCPYPGCGYMDHLMPARVPGGPPADIGWAEHGWFHCPRCGRHWEGEIRDDRVLALEPAGAPAV